MKVPDKIYIPLYPNYNLDGVHLGDDWMYEPQKGCNNVTYIRKHVLLEWAKEVHDSGPIKDSADKGDAWSIGYLCGMKDIIDKLNEM